MIKLRVKLGTSRVALGGYGIGKYQMAILGKVAHDEEKKRVAAGIGSDDSQMKPLALRYAQWKRKIGRQPIRNLTLTGAISARRLMCSSLNE